MYFKSVLGALCLLTFVSLVKGESCDLLSYQDSQFRRYCYSDDNGEAYYLRLEGAINDTVMEQASTIKSLNELVIDNTEGASFDMKVLKNLDNLKTFSYQGPITDESLESIATLTQIDELSVSNTENGNMNLNLLKGLNITNLYVNCHNYEPEDRNYITSKSLNTFANTLEFLSIDDCLVEENEDLTTLTNVNTVHFSGWVDPKALEKVAEMSSVTEVYIYHQKGVQTEDKTYVIDVSVLKDAPKLTDLSITAANTRIRTANRIASGSLKGFKHLKKLLFSKIALNEQDISDIISLTGLESLTFRGCPLLGEEKTKLYDSLVALKDSLISLEYTYPKKSVYDSDKFNEIPEFIFSLVNLKNLTINDAYINSIPEKITELKSLEYLDLSKNSLDVLPDFLNQLLNLKYIDVSGNSSLKGKTLISDKIEYCDYSKTDVCKSKDVPCLQDDDKIEACVTTQCTEFFDYLINKGVTDFDGSICKVNEKGQIDYAFVYDEFNEEDVKKFLSYKSITSLNLQWSGNQNIINYIGKLTNLQTLKISLYDRVDLDLSPLKNLKKLTSLDIEFTIGSRNEVLNIKKNSLRKLTSLKELSIDSFNINKDVINEIGKLTKLEKLTLEDSEYPDGFNFSALKNLKKLVELRVTNFWDGLNPIKEIPKYIYSLTKLEILVLNNQKITTISSDIKKLKNLSILNLKKNNITTIPEVLNTLPNLNRVNFEENPNLEGKIVHNDNLVICDYDRNNANICREKDLKCLYRPESIKMC